MATSKELNFSKFLKSKWVTNVANYAIVDRTIVTNIGTDPCVLNTSPPTVLAPRTSSIFKDVSIKSADSLVLIHIPSEINIGGCILEDGWHQLHDLATDYSKDVPLYKSPQFEVGTATFDPKHVVKESDKAGRVRSKKHKVKVNVWYCPEKTNCGLHNNHTSPEMLEVHTQVYGTGRMQKFHKNDFGSLYEDVILGPGMTHVPFAGIDEHGNYFYPWHQYYGDTDCIWMAVEYHPM